MSTVSAGPKTWDLAYFKNDLQGGLVSFLVAVPLCLGIALASGAPLFSGIIAGIVGGLVVGALSRSAVSISGPEAGLILVVVSSLEALGSFKTLQLAICVAGVMQLIMGVAKAGIISNFFPSSVIKGMLAAIGIILILKQLPHMLGYDADAVESLALFSWNGGNLEGLLEHALREFNATALVIAGVSLAVLISWEQPFFKQNPVLSAVPAALVVIILGVTLNTLAGLLDPSYMLAGTHLVQLPVPKNTEEFIGLFTLPDFSQLANVKIYSAAFSIALVASLEALLAVEATDELDPLKRKTPTNRELKAQGVGNFVSGLLGGLPLTSFIVRSSVSINAGGRTRIAALIHGSFLLLSVILFPRLLNMIPWAALAAILLITGYKLAHVSIFRQHFQAGITEFLPFIVTIGAILLTDLLIGIGVGAAVGLFFVLRETYKNAHFFQSYSVEGQEHLRISLGEHVSFLNKASIMTVLKDIPVNTTVEIDGTNSAFIDRDVLGAIENFRETARQRNIQLIFLRKADDYAQNIASQPHVTGKEADFEAYYKLFENNRNWVAEKLRRNPRFFEPTAQQTPKFLFIGCSDNHVSVSEMTGTAPGEVFVHRNVANLVVSTNLNLSSVLQYAVEVLKIQHIIVCGHYGCRGVKAAMQNVDEGAVSSWLSTVREVMHKHDPELGALETEDEQYRRLVELNVIEQVYNLHQNASVQQAYEGSKPLHLHGWVYDIHGGIIRDLEVDVRRDFAEYDTIFRYQVAPEGLRRFGGNLHQPPSIYSVSTGTGRGPIIAIPPFDGDAALGVP